MLLLNTQNVNINIIKKQIRIKLNQICFICVTTKIIIRISRKFVKIRYINKNQFVYVNI